MKKTRNPYWQWLKACRHKIIVAKKGKNSYNRKIKHREKAFDLQ